MRKLKLVLGLLLSVTAATATIEPDSCPIAPRLLTLERSGTLNQAAAEVAKQTGFQVTVDPALGPKTIAIPPSKSGFWPTLEHLAKQVDGRIALHDGGSRIGIEPRRNSRESSSLHGPFRTVSRQIISRIDLDSGTASYALVIEAQWEPRFPVFRISSTPQIVKAVDDRGTALTTTSAKAFAQPTGYSHLLEAVRLGGLTRNSHSIPELNGFYTVTASEKMLAFRFDDLTGKPPFGVNPQSGVAARLRGLTKDEGVWEVEVELNYPAGQPKFESFEESLWLNRNTMRLVSPGGGKAFAPDDHQILEAGQRVVAVYRFKENPAKGLVDPRVKGWSVVYEAPAPLIEFNVPFALKNIPLP